tara:strand:- start:184 stop:690 length:507 start_codon:yes stop_codon:yes gene_type:complete
MNKGILLPNYSDIIKLEKFANKEGSGITFYELVGKWKFQSVWKKGSDTIDNFSSTILQILFASLELSIDETTNDLSDELVFEIRNSIKFGLLTIVFFGKAFLKGKRPLLLFYFKNLYLKIGDFNIMNKSLEKIDLKKMPFFSLIAINKKKEWLCARGKGGGLAIWVRD